MGTLISSDICAPVRWVEVPAPDEAYDAFSGFFLIQATSSCTVFTPRSAFTISTLGT